jgi:hypothetical protein
VFGSAARAPSTATPKSGSCTGRAASGAGPRRAGRREIVTAKALAALEALLWAFDNAESGFCFPSYETIAAAAHCARSTVAEALKTLEEAGVLSWVQRIKRVREQCADLLGDNGWRWRILRTSNAYRFRDPSAPRSEDEPF